MGRGFWRWGLAIVGIIAIFFTSYLVLIHPWMIELAEYQANIEKLSNEKMRLQHLIAEHDQIELQLTSLKKLEQKSGYFTLEPSPDTAAQEMIERIETLVDANGANIVITQPHTPTPDTNSIKLHVQLTGNEELLIKLLHKIEGSTPLLIIDNLTIRSRQPQLQNTNNHGNTLDIRLDIMGFLAWERA